MYCSHLSLFLFFLVIKFLKINALLNYHIFVCLCAKSLINFDSFLKEKKSVEVSITKK